MTRRLRTMLVMLALAGFYLGCGLLSNTHTMTIINQTGNPVRFSFDGKVYDLAARQSIKISDVSSGFHSWAAVWEGAFGAPFGDEGQIDVQTDGTLRITLAGVRL